MAIVKLNEGYGYGQVELNKVAFRRTGRIEAQCALAIDEAENGMILAIDPVNHTVGLPTSTELIALNYTAEHMYDAKDRGLKDFVLKRGEFYPRLGYLEKGDIFTTNTVVYDNASSYAPKAGDYATVDATTGYIKVVGSTSTNAILKVVEITTMPDGAPAIKFIAIK